MMIRPRPTYRIVFESIGAALVALVGFVLLGVAFIWNGICVIFEHFFRK